MITDLQEKIKMAELEIEWSEERRRRFLKKFRETGDKLSLELAQDEEERITRISIAIAEEYKKIREYNGKRLYENNFFD